MNTPEFISLANEYIEANSDSAQKVEFMQQAKLYAKIANAIMFLGSNECDPRFAEDWRQNQDEVSEFLSKLRQDINGVKEDGATSLDTVYMRFNLNSNKTYHESFSLDSLMCDASNFISAWYGDDEVIFSEEPSKKSDGMLSCRFVLVSDGEISEGIIYARKDNKFTKKNAALIQETMDTFPETIVVYVEDDIPGVQGLNSVEDSFKLCPAKKSHWGYTFTDAYWTK